MHENYKPLTSEMCFCVEKGTEGNYLLYFHLDSAAKASKVFIGIIVRPVETTMPKVGLSWRLLVACCFDIFSFKVRPNAYDFRILTDFFAEGCHQRQ